RRWHGAPVRRQLRRVVRRLDAARVDGHAAHRGDARRRAARVLVRRGRAGHLRLPSPRVPRMSRLERVWAIAVQDWRVVLGGSGWLRLPSLAAAILLPAAALHLPHAPLGPPKEQPPVAVSGAIPFA